MFTQIEPYLPRDIIHKIYSYIDLSQIQCPLEPPWLKPYISPLLSTYLADDLVSQILEYTSYRSFVCIHDKDNKIFWYGEQPFQTFSCFSRIFSKNIFVTISIVDPTNVVFAIAMPFQSKEDFLNYLHTWYCSQNLPWIN
jgi:hypothetical protein